MFLYSTHADLRSRSGTLRAWLWVFFFQCLFSYTGVAGDVSVMQNGQWRIDYHLDAGTADIFFNGKPIILQAYASAHLPDEVTSKDLSAHKIKRHFINDHYGRGFKYTVESSNNTDEKMTQNFWLYENLDYILADVEVHKKGGIASNYLSPLTSCTTSDCLPAGDDRALFVPFDNDMWVRYDAIPFGSKVTSYEVSALYENACREGLIVGSVEHDVWKTGVVSTTSSNRITSLEVYGGITSSNITHDVLPHGKVSGETIKSPKIFIGYFEDWRQGMEAYAAANAAMTPPRPWPKGVPFGWNSWGKLQFGLNYQKAIQVSDFFARQLPAYQNNGVAYIGLDAGWSSFSEENLRDFVLHCQANHQQAGIYFTPFTAWTHDGDKAVDGTSWHYKDIFLYANGKPQTVDGGVALDPTHPGTKALIESEIHHFQRDGFTYVKADFMTHGALEADHYFDPKVTTGIEAYNEGMKFIDAVAGKDIYLNLSISPLFPAQYADSRRISCDTFGAIDQTEYMLNSLTYGWWLSKVYDFNDADHMVLGDYSEGENRARITSSAITGIFISGDDLSESGGATGKQRAKQFFSNSRILDVARIQKSFMPVEGNTENHASNLFCFQAGKATYLAVFNFAKANADFIIEPERIGLPGGVTLQAEELWSGATQDVSGPLVFHLAPTDAALYKLSVY